MFKRKTTEVQVNGIEVLIDAPIPGRPKVLRITTDDGRRMVLGDYGQYNPEESRALRSVVEPTRDYWRHHLTEDELEQLAEAERDLTNTLGMVDEAAAKREAARLRLMRHMARHGDGPLEAEISGQQRHLQNVLDQAEREWAEARKLEGHARSAQTDLQQSLGRTARLRMSPPQVVQSTEIDVSNWRSKLRAAAS